MSDRYKLKLQGLMQIHQKTEADMKNLYGGTASCCGSAMYLMENVKTNMMCKLSRGKTRSELLGDIEARQAALRICGIEESLVAEIYNCGIIFKDGFFFLPSDYNVDNTTEEEILDSVAAILADLLHFVKFADSRW